jgi:hypothetical protein
VACIAGYGRGEDHARGFKARLTRSASHRDRGSDLRYETIIGRCGESLTRLRSRLERMTDRFTTETEFENRPRELWADGDTVRAVADNILGLEGWPLWQAEWHALCTRYGWDPLSHLLECGRQRINVSEFDDIMRVLTHVPVFDRDRTGRFMIMGRHVHYIEWISNTEKTVAMERLQHLLHFVMGVMEWIHWEQVYRAMWGGYFCTSEEFRAKVTHAILSGRDS